MQTYQFSALGTTWHLSVDAHFVDAVVFETIQTTTQEFERKFSRFIEGNEVTQWRTAQPGTYTISTQLAQLLLFAQQLKETSGGVFDPAVGTLLEHAGYDQNYSFSQKSAQIESWQLPSWHVHGKSLTIDAPVLFDLGGFAKGYWIDQVSKQLQDRGYAYHLVDGGGDMYATTKADGSSWNIAIEYPGKTDMALGTVQLLNQGFAASDVFRRTWKNWHHLLDIQNKQPQKNVLGAVAVATTAMHADGMTALLTLSLPDAYPNYYSNENSCEYLVLAHDNKLYTSPGWTGEVFT